MCSGSTKDLLNPYADSKGASGEIHDVIDPIGSAVFTGDKHKLDPLKLFERQHPQAPAQGPKRQTAKPADTGVLKGQKRAGGTSNSGFASYESTMLTSSSSADNRGSATLLG